jgi:hypothetical protein
LSNRRFLCDALASETLASTGYGRDHVAGVVDLIDLLPSSEVVVFGGFVLFAMGLCSGFRDVDLMVGEDVDMVERALGGREAHVRNNNVKVMTPGGVVDIACREDLSRERPYSIASLRRGEVVRSGSYDLTRGSMTPVGGFRDVRAHPLSIAWELRTAARLGLTIDLGSIRARRSDAFRTGHDVTSMVRGIMSSSRLSVFLACVDAASAWGNYAGDHLIASGRARQRAEEAAASLARVHHGTFWRACLGSGFAEAMSRAGVAKDVVDMIDRETAAAPAADSVAVRGRPVDDWEGARLSDAQMFRAEALGRTKVRTTP